MKKLWVIFSLFIFIGAGCSGETNNRIEVKLLSPSNGDMLKNSSVNFKWEIFPNVTKVKYNLYLGKSFSSLEEVAKNITMSTYRIRSLDRGVYYFWKVEVITADGEKYLSHTYSFRITDGGSYVLASPILMAPKVDSNFNKAVTLSFEWVGVTSPVGGVYYRFFLGESPDDLKVYADKLTVTTFKINDLNIGVYYWKVEAVDDGGKISDSSVWRFLVSKRGTVNLPPTPPELVYPAQNAALPAGDVTFRWKPAEDPEGGSVTYALLIAGSNKIFVEKVKSIEGTSYTLHFTNDGNYYWKIIAFDNAGNMTSSLVGKFSIGYGEPSEYVKFKGLMVSSDYGNNPTICGLTVGGKIYCWGSVNGAGQGLQVHNTFLVYNLERGGDDWKVFFQEPKQPLFPGNFTFKEIGYHMPVALTVDGRIWVWEGGYPYEIKNEDGVKWSKISDFTFIDENGNLWYYGFDLKRAFETMNLYYLTNPVKIEKPESGGEWIKSYFLQFGAVGVFKKANKESYYYYGLYATGESNNMHINYTGSFPLKLTEVAGSPWISFISDGIGINNRGEMWYIWVRPYVRVKIYVPLKKLLYLDWGLWKNDPNKIEFCGIDMTNDLICRGKNFDPYSSDAYYGFMMTYTTDLTQPTVVKKNIDYNEIVMTPYEKIVGCGLKNGDIYCWGTRRFATMGIYFESKPYMPFMFDSYYTNEWKSITAYSDWRSHACGIDKYGYLFCWGDGEFWPVELSGIKRFSLLPEHGNYGLVNAGIVAIDQSHKRIVGYDKIVSYPTTGRGSKWVALGIGTTYQNHYWWYVGNWYMLDDAGDLYQTSFASSDTTPVLVESYPSQVTWIDFYAGKSHICAISYNHQVYCMGSNADGQIGDVVSMGESIDKLVRVPSLVSKKFMTVACGVDKTCAITLDGNMYCWGGGSTVPELVVNPLGKRWKKVYMNKGIVFAIDEDSNLWVWGSNNSNEIMTYPENYTPSSPVPSYSVTFKVKDVVTDGRYLGCALDLNNHLWCWGNGYKSNLGGFADTWVPHRVQMKAR